MDELGDIVRCYLLSNNLSPIFMRRSLDVNLESKERRRTLLRTCTSAQSGEYDEEGGKEYDEDESEDTSATGEGEEESRVEELPQSTGKKTRTLFKKGSGGKKSGGDESQHFEENERLTF